MSETVTRTEPITPVAPLRADPWSSFITLIRWTLHQVGPVMPLVIVLQAILSAGMIIGFGFLIPDIDPASALFLSTGAPTVLLLLIGVVVVPQGVATARLNGSYQYMRTLPVPRPLVLLADMSVWVLVALPSIVVAALVAWWYHGIEFAIDWPLILLAGVLVAVMGTSVGYALAVTFPPMVAQILTQVLIFFVMMFSPINYPASQLPEWFQRVHDFLPFEAGATLIRAGIASDVFEWDVRDLVVLAVWTLGGLVISLRALMRRG